MTNDSSAVNGSFFFKAFWRQVPSVSGPPAWPGTGPPQTGLWSSPSAVSSRGRPHTRSFTSRFSFRVACTAASGPSRCSAAPLWCAASQPLTHKRRDAAGRAWPGAPGTRSSSSLASGFRRRRALLRGAQSSPHGPGRALWGLTSLRERVGREWRTVSLRPVL